MAAQNYPFETLLDLAVYAWRPVLRLLAAEGDYSKIDFEKAQNQALHLPAGWPEVQSLQEEPPAERIQYLSVEEIVEIHDVMIREFGGETGVRDLGILESAGERIRRGQVYGASEFPTLYQKAAALMHSIMLYHPFVDGQKRTGISSSFVFLGLNGYTIWSRDVADEIATAVRTAKGELEVSDLAEWISMRAMAIRSAIFVIPFTLLLRKMDRTDSCPNCDAPVTWRTYLNECPSCGESYLVEPISAMISHQPDNLGFPAEVLSAGRLVSIRSPQDIQSARVRQSRIDEANEAATLRLRDSGRDPAGLLVE